MSISALRQPIVFLDVETGGPDASRHPLLAIGLVTLQPSGELTRPLYLKVQHPQYAVAPGALEVTGIDLVAHHRQAQPVDVVATALREYAAATGRVMLGGHNFEFDRRFLKMVLPDMSEVFRRGYADTKLSAQFLIHAGKLPRQLGTPLSQLAAHFGIIYRAHNALEDARATAQVYWALLQVAAS